MSESKWSAELNHNYRNGLGEPMWILRYNPTPGGTKNADGTTSFSMNFPALQLTEWVGEPEKAAGEIATILNAHRPLADALKLANDFMSGFAGDELQDGIDDRLATIRAALALAGEA